MGHVGTLEGFVFVFDKGDKWPPEFSQQGFPGFFVTRDGIQFVFKVGGEIVIDITGEMFG